MTTAEAKPTPTRNRELDWQQLIEVALDTPGSVGNVYNRFYDYSFLNQMFLRMQGVREPVATYKRWQKLGRQVLRGSKAHGIVRPVVIERKNDDGEETEDKLLRFKVVKCLFTVSQTDGDPLPEIELPRWDLPTALRNLEISSQPFELLDGNTQGYSWGRNFAINPVAAHPVRTTFHELGHIMLGHTNPQPAFDPAMHRGHREFQAEATAYLVMNELDELTPDVTSHSRGYIRHWLNAERPSDRAIRQVFAATDAILKAGRLATDVSRTTGV
jgi:antirestriction protein ArdC